MSSSLSFISGICTILLCEVVDFGLLNSIVIGVWNSSSHSVIIEILIIWTKKGVTLYCLFLKTCSCVLSHVLVLESNGKW